MHLNALYRAAEAGKQSLTDCARELASAAKRSVLTLPIRYWHIRQARQHLDQAKRHLEVVRDNVSLVAALGDHRQIDTSGGYNVSDLLTGGLLASLVDVSIRSSRVERSLDTINGLLLQVGELMLRMRKAGAVE